MDNGLYTGVRLMQDGDLSAVTEIHLKSFPKNRSTLLGRKFVYSEYRWFFKHFQNLAIVYQEDGIIVGFVVGATSSFGVQLFRDLLPKIVIALVMRPWLFFYPKTFSDATAFIKSLRYKFPKKQNATDLRHQRMQSAGQAHLSLASIAVVSTYRRTGIGDKLLRAFECQAALARITSIHLTVFGDNFPARKAYERGGWVCVLVKNKKAHYRKHIDITMPER